MFPLLTKEFELLHPGHEHFDEIQVLCKKVYPFAKPWSIPQLEAHQSYFPEGQLIVIDKKNAKVIGLAFSVIISWDDYSPQDNWQDFTSGGYFHNHDPHKGKTLYGAEVMVDPAYRGRGIGKMLYRGRQEIAKKYHLKRIRAGARIRGYHRFENKMSPEEYTKDVVNKTLSDPTLSFQLGQGFVVLDVAKNYLSDDPESLGYAALIEWLNPEVAKESDYRKQRLSMNSFMNNQKFLIEHLPRELRRMVRKMTLLLGKVIREYEGDAFYDKIESYRQYLKKFRTSTDKKREDFLLRKLKTCSKGNQAKIAHAFSLLLELINVCESAYRTWRLRNKKQYYPMASKIDLNFVLTAHPTEARSNDVVSLLSRLTDLCVDSLSDDFSLYEKEIISHLRMLWQHPLIKYEKTTVLSEADYIYTLIFSDNIISFILSDHASYSLKLSTWVGGDKDGHPGIDYKIMKECLSGSRAHIVRIITAKLETVKKDLTMLGKPDHHRHHGIKKINHLLAQIKKLISVRTGDGLKIKTWRHSYKELLSSSKRFIYKHYEILAINRILELFPAMVMPIELRENAAEIHQALTLKKSAIRLMLLELQKITSGGNVNDYAHGFIISHCSDENDISAANKLAQDCLKSKKMPIIPLFEDKLSIISGHVILKKWLGKKENIAQVTRHWHCKLEVMLGYSDSAKQIGMLASRALIRDAMVNIESTLKRKKLTPIFFQGAGGSVARGGGSLRDQISWWPNSAIEAPKLTIQGEMIQRTFATGEILNSQCLLLSHEARVRRVKRDKPIHHETFQQFISFAEEEYKLFINDKTLIEYCLGATPYHYLDILKIGSRPSKRSTKTPSLDSLRAIPWVLCWTQTRLILPAWWGAGAAWQRMTKTQKAALVQLYEVDPFFSSFVKVLGYTLAKVEMSIWEQYLLSTYGQQAKKTFAFFEEEYKRAVSFVYDVTQSRQMVGHRPWLEESIHLRSPYINILNLLQIIAMQTENEPLLKETLVGIACGMLTTG